MVVSAAGNLLVQCRAVDFGGAAHAFQMMLGVSGATRVQAWGAGWEPFRFSTISLALLFYLAVLSAAAFVLRNSVMTYNRVGNMSLSFLIPVFGVILSSAVPG
jgi:hypothetical protein